jgi:TonB family protein
MSIRSRSFLLNSLFLAFAAPSFAQTPDISEHIETIVNAKPLSRIEPKYPLSAARSGQEGWVKVSFVIDEKGNVVDPLVQDSSGIKSFEKEALRAMKKWKYSPAIQDGKPIEQCQMEVQMDYKMGGQSGVTRKFNNAYVKIVEAINSKAFEVAEKQLAEMADSQLWTHSESGYFWLADSMYAKEMNDIQRELVSVNRALSSGKDAFSAQTYFYLLNRQFILFVADTQYAKSMQTYKLILEQEDNTDVVAELSPYATKVQTILQSNEPLVRSAEIRKSGSSYHELSRESFALRVNEGELDEVQIRCANKRSRFTPSENSMWNIPSSWGKCTVFVTGTPKSKFDVVEIGAYQSDI